MSAKSTIGLSLALSLGLNAPGLIALAGKLFEPLGILTLVILPFVALWGLPGYIFRGAYPNAFQVTEFGVYPDAASGWILVFGFWVVIGSIATVTITKVRALHDARKGH